MAVLILLICSLVPVAVSTDNLMGAFNKYMSTFGEEYGRQELRLRFNLFKSSQEAVEEHNNQKDRSWDMAINRFSAMTVSEKGQYLGLLNETEALDSADSLVMDSGSLLGAPESVDNVALGFVTRPKDQRSCGSCWAFAAVAALEGSYARTVGALKSFSEKEILDCSFEGGSADGCDGGWYQYAWNYIKKYGRLATLKDAPYDYARDRACEYRGRVDNGLKNARYTHYYTVKRTEAELMSAVARAVVAVAMIVEDNFYSYGSGIYEGCRGSGNVGHAVTMVGYGRDYWKVKNSWGGNWGEGGYVRFTRGKYNVCRLIDYAKFPVMEKITNSNEPEDVDDGKERKRVPNHGCSFGDDYPCSDINCNYGCKGGTCWSQCNGVCGIVGNAHCTNCKEWCYLTTSCSKHEDCFASRYDSCNSACSL